MQSRHIAHANANILPLEDFGQLQKKYQSLPLPKRAVAVLADAEPALKGADEVLQQLITTPRVRQIFENMRKNPAITGKMRPSEARNTLIDGNADFIDMARRKLQAWRKTMERIGSGEGVISEQGMEYLPNHAPVALAFACISTTESYLAIVQLALAELARADEKNAAKHRSNLARIRRCATLIADCEHASGIAKQVH